MSDDIDLSDAIADAASAPKRVKGDEGEAEQHNLQDLIAADEYLAKKAANSTGAKRMKIYKMVPPGAT